MEQKSAQHHIPKIIHYCWFGNTTKPPLVERCIQSWRENLHGYEIREWNEQNFPVGDYAYTDNAYKKKKWAFVADYVRLIALKDGGGIYLDADMFVCKSFDDFIDTAYTLVLGREDSVHISAGMIASIAHHPYIDELLLYYDTAGAPLEPIPVIMTRIWDKSGAAHRNDPHTHIFPAVYFYPFQAETISSFNYRNAPQESYAVHLWNYSWGHPLNKMIKRLGIYPFVKKLTELLGIKRIIKKLLHME